MTAADQRTVFLVTSYEVVRGDTGRAGPELLSSSLAECDEYVARKMLDELTAEERRELDEELGLDANSDVAANVAEYLAVFALEEGDFTESYPDTTALQRLGSYCAEFERNYTTVFTIWQCVYE